MSEDKGGIIMKKLLLLGALLVVGATSFAYKQSESLGVVQDSGPAGTPPAVHSKEGSVGLMLVSKGSVVAPAENEYVLQIKPTKTAETSTDSIVFNFTDLTPGVRKSVDGGFEAKILKGTDAGTVEVEIPAAEITSKLEVSGVAKGNTTTINLKGATTTGLVDVGTLTYTLTAGLSDAKTYTGNIKAEVEVAGTATSSTFNDGTAAVVVTVEAEAFQGVTNS